MPRQCFEKLCYTIRDRVGKKVFKSEAYLEELNAGTTGTVSERKMHVAQSNVSGGFVSGEVKGALALRMLAGGSYLDLSLLFDISCSASYNIFHSVVSKWFNHKSISSLNRAQYLNSIERMAKVASDFAIKSSGKFTGCIGALDGWLV
mmetsp:Transcript_29769/g.45643  ORF Transcript_29769/g.45643 Transcript_29769/m.45643 type:complete len:148 (+) Transcript_29769:322-765(+)